MSTWKALSAVSGGEVRVEKEEFIGLVGRSYAGKSQREAWDSEASEPLMKPFKLSKGGE